MPWITPLDAVFMSICDEKYHLKANVCSHIIRTRLQYNSGDGNLEDDKVKILKLIEQANEKQLKAILEEVKKLIQPFT
jgi:hypothetical protein